MRSADRRRANQRGDVVQSPVADLGDVGPAAAVRPGGVHAGTLPGRMEQIDGAATEHAIAAWHPS